METTNILKKLQAAKDCIKKSKIEKQGRNSFSNYKFFTPEQVEHMVGDACSKNNLLTKFDLIRNELGIVGQLTVFETEKGESLVFTMATAMPEIKATNITQQLGGCMTYTERYLKMTAFGIVENALDFDDDAQQVKPVKTETQKQQPAKQPQNDTDYAALFARAIEQRNVNIADVKKHLPEATIKAKFAEFKQALLDKKDGEVIQAIISETVKEYKILSGNVD
mgnify:CR=1 FL=1